MHSFAELNVPEGSAGIHWFEQNGYAIKDSQGTIILIDPYFPHDRPADRFVHAEPPLNESELPTSYVLLTHSHSDHTCAETLSRIHEGWPEANERHYHFMLEGLREVQTVLEAIGIQMVILHQSPDSGAVEMAHDAASVVVDAGHLRIQREWRSSVAERIPCVLSEVETNLIVPVEEASYKEDFSAGTFRPRKS